MRQTIVPNQHEKDEWSRIANAAYAAQRNEIGHQFSSFASMSNGCPLNIETFDMLQDVYRNWLNHNKFPEHNIELCQHWGLLC